MSQSPNLDKHTVFCGEEGIIYTRLKIGQNDKTYDKICKLI